MTTIFIIHGAYGNSHENWFLWLKKELEKLGPEVFIPNFPTPKDQTLNNWMKIFNKYELDEDSIVIGHSLGVPFLLSVLEKKKVKAAFFIAGFANLLGDDTFDKINLTFVNKIFNWDLIKKNCNHFYVYHSNNDPYVSLENGKYISNQLDVKLILIKGAGHFNESAGYTKFPLLLEKVKEEI